MTWQNPKITKTTELDAVFSVCVEFTDAEEFATDTFTYKNDRVTNDASGRAAFKTAATSAVEAERLIRQDLTTKEASFLTFMNQA